jgi:hypothetical protein
MKTTSFYSLSTSRISVREDQERPNLCRAFHVVVLSRFWYGFMVLVFLLLHHGHTEMNREREREREREEK